MKKQTITIIMGIMLLALASAYYPGETIEVNHNFGSSNITLSVIDNSTFINTSSFGLDSNLTHANITIPQDLIPNGFKIVLTYLKEQEVQTITVYRSGGSRTKYVDRNVTEYVNVTEFIEKIKYIDKEIPHEEFPLEVESTIQEEKKGFFKSIWDWIRSIFS